MPSQASGQAPKPTKGTSRPVRKPKALGLTGDIAAMGGTAAKSAGHMAHDAVHAGRRVVKALNPFD